jgi:anaerobic dimethyl sulfoxide reductase subunit C
MINLREWALPVYTIMMQMAAGGMLILWIVYSQAVRRHGEEIADRLIHNLVLIIFITVIAAIIGSHYHLSRPLLSIRSVMNFKTSWLSREVIFTIFFAMLIGVLLFLHSYQIGSITIHLAVGWCAVAMGIVTVYCMSRVYMLPTQAAWNSFATPIAFFSATLLLGNLAVSALLLMNLHLAVLREETDLETQQQIIQRTLWWVMLFAVATTGIELATYAFQISELSSGSYTARVSIDLLLGLYRVLFGGRLLLLVLGVSMLVGVVFWQRKANRPIFLILTPIYFSFLFVLVSEVLGRFLFYAVHVRTGI